jgi:3'-5' exoribonuclease
MPPVNIADLPVGARVHHELRVVDRDQRRTRTGDPFVILTLGNRYGEIRTAPIWSDKLHWAEGAVAGTIVQVVGEVRAWAEGGSRKRQLELSAPLRPITAEQVRIDDFLPRIDEDPAALWSGIDRVRGEIASPRLRAIVGLLFDDDEFRVRFERAPGSTRGHHAKVGGLLRHVTEVTFIARTIANTMRSGSSSPASVDLVTAGALLHDIGKVDAYSVSPAGFDTTPQGHLVGHVVLGCMLLDRRAGAAGKSVCSDEQLLEVQHLILAHHGTLEHGSPVRPMTLEAEIIHWADQASAKASSISESYSDPEAFPEGSVISGRIWQLDNRRLWRRREGWD